MLRTASIGFDPALAATRLLYSGEMFDARVGQQYLRARWYDATTGRFNRLDDFFGKLRDPQSLHKYAYAHGDPTNLIDPSGRFSIGGLGGMLGFSASAWLSSAGAQVQRGLDIARIAGPIIAAYAWLNIALAWSGVGVGPLAPSRADALILSVKALTVSVAVMPGGATGIQFAGGFDLVVFRSRWQFLRPRGPGLARRSAVPGSTASTFSSDCSTRASVTPSSCSTTHFPRSFGSN